MQANTKQRTGAQVSRHSSVKQDVFVDPARLERDQGIRASGLAVTVPRVGALEKRMRHRPNQFWKGCWMEKPKKVKAVLRDSRASTAASSRSPSLHTTQLIEVWTASSSEALIGGVSGGNPP